MDEQRAAEIVAQHRAVAAMPPPPTKASPTAAPLEPAMRVVITDFDMPFWSMVALMIKWTVAFIPAAIIIGIIGVVGSALFVGLISGIVGP